MGKGGIKMDFEQGCLDKYIYINDNAWRIVFIDQQGMKTKVKMEEDEYVQGYTEYATNTIYICKEVANLKRVMIHELTHAWQEEYGHNQYKRTYETEDVCEIVASIYGFLENLNKEERLW